MRVKITSDTVRFRWRKSYEMSSTLPQRYTIYVACPGERPFFGWMKNFVWVEEDVDTDTDGDSYPRDSRTWTELTMITRDERDERFDVDPVQQNPLILKVRSEIQELAARAAYALAVYTGGGVSKQADGSFDAPDVLIPYMGKTFDLAAALQRNEWLKYPAHKSRADTGSC